MPKALPNNVKSNIDKCRSAAIAAVDVYNRPGPHFRTAHFLVLIIIAWTALFHGIFYRRKRRPWYRKRTSSAGRAIRYVKIDGDPKHWDLSECLKQYFEDKHPPERKNLEFLIGIRNKIEHRNLPVLDAALYGECQATLLNLEQLIVKEFGQKYALAEQLVVSLQFSQIIPEEKKKAAKILASGEAKTVKEYIEKFRGGLPTSVLNSIKYSFNVFLVPKVANRKSAADAAVQFIHVDEASPEELSRLEKLNILIREKHIPIANLDLYKPSKVVEELKQRLPYVINMNTHTRAWKHYKVRPKADDSYPDRTRSEYCIYDEVHGDYVYTRAWIEKLVRDLSDVGCYEKIVGFIPRAKQ